MRTFRFLLSIGLLLYFLPAVQAQTASPYRHILWYYLNRPSTENQRDWYEQADGSWVEQYVNGASSSYTVIAQNVSVPVFNGSFTTVTGRVVEKSDQSMMVFIPDEMSAGMWLPYKAPPGSFDGSWSYLAAISSVDGAIAAIPAGTPPVQSADNQMPVQPAADNTTAAADTSAADALQDKKDDLQSQIDDANSDIQLKQEDIQDSQSSIQRFQSDPTCTGIPGLICQAGIAKFRNEINSDNQAISSDQQTISTLQQKLAALGGASTDSDGNGGSSGSSGGGSYSGPNADWVAKMLARAQPGWSCPATAESPVMSKPIVASDLPCMRDKYVAAAVVAAWAAECHARLNMESQAEDNANTMMQSLNSARSLCSNAPAVAGGQSCTTLNVFSCSE